MSSLVQFSILTFLLITYPVVIVFYLCHPSKTFYTYSVGNYFYLPFSIFEKKQKFFFDYSSYIMESYNIKKKIYRQKLPYVIINHIAFFEADSDFIGIPLSYIHHKEKNLYKNITVVEPNFSPNPISIKKIAKKISNIEHSNLPRSSL